MLSYLLALILLPITYYSITRKTKFQTPPDFNEIEKEINEWLRSRAFQAFEEASTILDRISYIDRKESVRIADFVQVSLLPRPLGSIRTLPHAITDEGITISPEAYLTDRDNSNDVSDIAEKIQHIITGIQV